jgi:hypothetical protein
MQLDRELPQGTGPGPQLFGRAAVSSDVEACTCMTELISEMAELIWAMPSVSAWKESAIRPTPLLTSSICATMPLKAAASLALMVAPCSLLLVELPIRPAEGRLLGRARGNGLAGARQMFHGEGALFGELRQVGGGPPHRSTQRTRHKVCQQQGGHQPQAAHDENETSRFMQHALHVVDINPGAHYPTPCRI